MYTDADMIAGNQVEACAALNVEPLSTLRSRCIRLIPGSTLVQESLNTRRHIRVLYVADAEGLVDACLGRRIPPCMNSGRSREGKAIHPFGDNEAAFKTAEKHDSMGKGAGAPDTLLQRTTMDNLN